MDPIRGDFGQRREHEVPQVHPGVRQDEAGGVQNSAVQIEQIEIEGPWSVGAAPLPPEGPLGGQERVEHGLRRPSGGVQKGCGVCERRVGGVGPRLGDAAAGDGEGLETQSVEPLQPGAHERCAGAAFERQIGADRDEGASVFGLTAMGLLRDYSVQ